ncbi:MAG: DNA helicase RecQ [Gemmatimonadales bacterium]|nr:DNA helicase RecQ [Gemmatimonadales bacterium]
MTSSATRILSSVFGYDTFRDSQQEIIDHLIEGGHSLVLMPTGGGKSLCYQIPALVREGTGLVVSPLIALMQDQVNALRQVGVRAACLNSSLPLDEIRRVEGQLLRGELDLVYLAPERLLQDSTLEFLDRCRLSLVAIDEAHCISRWGHDFRPEYLQLDILRDRWPELPVLACTATADERTRREIVTKLRLGEGRVFVTGFDRPNIRYRVTPKINEKRQLLDFIRGEHENDAGIVYCLSRKRTEQVAKFLVDNGLKAMPYHAGLSAGVRHRHQDRFLNEDGLIIVATIAFGMGIDKPDVRFVAHLDLPKSIEAYYQETGRAGRDGLAANAWMAYGMQDVILHTRLAEESDADEIYKRSERQKLDTMLGYCETVSCRRQLLLEYFGESLPEPCGNCDTCLEPVDTFDGTEAAQKLLSCVARTGQRFGALYIIDVLRGSESERIGRFGHDLLSTYGIGTEFDVWQWRSIIRQMVTRGLLAVDLEGYGGLRLTPAARPVLQGEGKLLLRQETAAMARAKKPKKKKATVAILFEGGAEADGEANQALFESLRELRRTTAAEQEVPPYVIFHDKTLAAMALHRPTDEAEFLQISGVGQAKLERYGERFLAVIRESS